MTAKVYLDEDVHTFIADALRQRGIEALTTATAGRRGVSDTAQLRWAAGQGFVFLTYNVRDFPRINSEFAQRAEAHAGIIVANQEDPRANIRGLLSLLNTFDAGQLAGQLLYLNNWL